MTIWIFVIAIVLVESSATYTKGSNVSYRIPDFYESIAYHLNLNFPEDVFTDNGSIFNGKVQIIFKLKKVPDQIILHADENFIKIKNITFDDMDLPQDYYKVDNETDMLKINTPYPLEPHLYHHIIINYEGLVDNNDLFGLYKSSYTENGKTSYVLASQFPPFYARRAFPCFDEPGFKSVFHVSITAPGHMQILFNTPKYSEETKDFGRTKTIHFEPTQKISTYTLAFHIVDFDCTKVEGSQISQFRVCSRNATADTRKFALDLGPRLLGYYSNLTDYDYCRMMSNKSCYKMDVVAIPDYFSGGLENWGLVTGRETDLLYDPKLSSEKNKQRIAQTIAHEFAHQWFGNLVTMKWWSELYLSEGFGTYFEYFGLEKLFPDWKMETHFLIEQMHNALEEDASESTLALKSTSETPDDIVAKFSPISYSKGAAILRMVRYFLGSQNFIAGLRRYLRKNEYSSVSSKDLMQALSDEMDTKITIPPTDFQTIMENWINEPGYPIVNVKRPEDLVTISQPPGWSLGATIQDKYIAERPFPKDIRSCLTSGGKAKVKWYVPITYTTSEDTNKFDTRLRFWLSPNDRSPMVAKLPGPNSWIILNNNQIGYYRVNYDDTLWDRIASALDKENFDGIPEANRVQIIDDLFFLAKHRKISYGRLFKTIHFLRRDRSYFSLSSAIKGFNYIFSAAGEESESGKTFKLTLLLMLGDTYQSIPFDPEDSEDHLTALKRDKVFSFACKLGYLPCIEEVKKRFKDYANNKIRPHRDLRSLIYCNGIRYSENVTDWDFLWGEYKSISNAASEQEAILSGLACSKDPVLLKRLLLKTVDNSSEMRTQDTWTAFSSVYRSSSEGVDAAIEFFVENYEKIVKKYKSMLVIGDLLAEAASKVTNDDSVARLKAFVKEANKKHKEIASQAEEAVKAAETNLKTIRDCKSDINKYFHNTASKRSLSGLLGVTCIAFCILQIFSPVI